MSPIRIAFVLPALLSLMSAAAAGAAPVPVVDGFVLDEPLTLDHLTVWPVCSTSALPPIKSYLSLPAAQEQGLAVVRERGAEGAPPAAAPPPTQAVNTDSRQQVQQSQISSNQRLGQSAGPTVNQVVIENRGKLAILVLAGTVVKGGNQDRIIGQDFIIPPGQTVPVDAFCVEHGRWQAQREGRQTSGRFEAKNVLATFGARTSGQHEQNQGKVWEKVAEENRTAKKAPASGTLLATLEDDDARARARREKVSLALHARFQALAKGAQPPVGLAYAVDGRVRELRLFAHPQIFALYLDALVATMAVEADLAARAAPAAAGPVAVARAEDVVRLVKTAEAIENKEISKSSGNRNEKRHNQDVGNSNCFDAEQADRPVTKQYSNFH